MKTIPLQDITIFCITADSFPDGVMHAWHRLHKTLPATTGRTFYGISHGSANGIVYKAGVQEAFAGEGAMYGCETVVIPKGDYMAETILDFPRQMHRFGEVFQTMIHHPDCAADALCVEWYQNETDVVCLVKQKEKVAY